jgi:putative tryptophan/tyrosine transport system substrate-binding protein
LKTGVVLNLTAEGYVRRRDLIKGIAVSVAWPLAASAQQPERIRHVGALIAYAEKDATGRAAAAAFKEGLERLGWIDSKNIQVHYRFAAGDPALYKTFAAELVALSPDAILAGAAPAVVALQSLTRTIPIVFVLVADPVGLGFVQSLARPGGNVTGFSVYDEQLMGKWLDLLNKMAPNVRRIAVIFNPDTAPFAGLFNQSIERAAQSLGITVALAPIHDDAGIEEAISAQARQPGAGILVLPESFSITHRKKIIAAAAKYNLPAIGASDVFPRDGGLMSYWIDTIFEYSRAASYIDRILQGADPASLPIQQPTKFSLILNLSTAKTLGLIIPPDVLALANEVIE